MYIAAIFAAIMEAPAIEKFRASGCTMWGITRGCCLTPAGCPGYVLLVTWRVWWQVERSDYGIIDCKQKIHIILGDRSFGTMFRWVVFSWWYNIEVTLVTPSWYVCGPCLQHEMRIHMQTSPENFICAPRFSDNNQGKASPAPFDRWELVL